MDTKEPGRRKKGKRLKLKNSSKSVSINVDAFNVPTYDISINCSIQLKCRQSEIEAIENQFKALIKDWWEDSIIADPKHFICSVNGPRGYCRAADRLTKMYLLVDLNILIRKKVELGKWDNVWPQQIKDELNELMVLFELALNKRVEPAS